MATPASPPTPTPQFVIEVHGAFTCAVYPRGDRFLASEYGPIGGRWTVSDFWSRREEFTSAADARAGLERAALAALNEMGPCGKTHDEHIAEWRSWRDDCVDEVGGCGFGMQDVDQCRRGHPDDGCTYCGACGHDKTAPPAT